jgi:hypothetical protein
MGSMSTCGMLSRTDVHERLDNCDIRRVHVVPNNWIIPRLSRLALMTEMFVVSILALMSVMTMMPIMVLSWSHVCGIHGRFNHNGVCGDYVGWPSWRWCLWCARWPSRLKIQGDLDDRDVGGVHDQLDDNCSVRGVYEGLNGFDVCSVLKRPWYWV